MLVRFQLMQISGRDLLLTMHRDSTALVEATARSERLNQLLLDAEALSARVPGVGVIPRGPQPRLRRG